MLSSLLALQKAREFRNHGEGKSSKLELILAFLGALGNPDPTVRDIGRLANVDRDYLVAGLEDAAGETLLGDAFDQEGERV